VSYNSHASYCGGRRPHRPRAALALGIRAVEGHPFRVRRQAGSCRAGDAIDRYLKDDGKARRLSLAMHSASRPMSAPAVDRVALTPTQRPSHERNGPLARSEGEMATAGRRCEPSPVKVMFSRLNPALSTAQALSSPRLAVLTSPGRRPARRSCRSASIARRRLLMSTLRGLWLVVAGRRPGGGTAERSDCGILIGSGA
jgi:hypothetical protein